MYQVFLLIAFFTYGSTAPYSGFNLQKSLPMRQEQIFSQQPLMNVGFEQNDDSDVVDNTGAGYSYFKKQQIETRPFVRSQNPLTSQDFSEYAKSSAFTQQPSQTQVFPSGQEQFMGGSFEQQQQPDFSLQSKVLSMNSFDNQQQLQPVLPRQQFSGYGQVQQQDFQRVLPRQPSGGYGQVQQEEFQRVLPRQQFSGYGQVQQPDFQQVVTQQILLPETNLNFQQKKLGGYGSQEQDFSFVQQPKTWSTEQRSLNFGSSFGGQQPVSSSFMMQSNQQDDQEPMTSGVFISSQVPPQRFGSQYQG
jgi:hypothetical protein